MSATTHFPVLRVLRWAALALALLAGFSAAADDKGPLDVEATRNALTAIETALKQPNLSDADLLRLRSMTEPLDVALQSAIADLTPRLAASDKRLAELTPKAKDKDAAPVTDAATAELDNEKQRHDALDAKLRAARAMQLEADDLAGRIGAMRRQLFARETFARTSSLLSPQLWLSVSRELPTDAQAIAKGIGDWWAGVRSRITTAQGLGVAGALLALALAAGPISWMARRVLDRRRGASAPSRLRRALAAVSTMLVLSALPLLALWGVGTALEVSGLSGPQTQDDVEAILDAARLLAVINAIAQAMLAPYAAAWRLIPVGDRAARIFWNAAMAIAAIRAVERLIEPAADAVASLTILVAARAVGAALVALILIGAVRRLSPRDETGPAHADRWRPVRAVAWIIAFALLAAVALGYVAFAAFLVSQTIYLSVLFCLLYLIDVIVYDGVEALLSPDAPVGARLMGMFGLRRNVLAQLVVLAQGAARVALVAVAAAGVLEPWRVQSQDWFVSLHAAYFGFGVGGVTLSLSSLLSAAVAFFAGLFVTRLIQTWLTERLLPQTGLDAGVSNSISTIFGYLGGAVAVLLAAAQVGLDLQRLAIVVGALSVGIGFGLQSIANNFVSGLILLWERGVRVGDWVMVGADQGFVRRINARATEIETFDRATVIVPNSNLVTGVVKNWVNPDRVGRILIAINVAYDSDVEAVREILIDVARSNDLVLKIPAPSVVFADFGDWAFKFNLICFVDDVETAGRTQSELNFEILRRVREARVRIPTPPFAPVQPKAP